MRKIIQILRCPPRKAEHTLDLIYALCDDGTLLWRNCSESSPWQEEEKPPQAFEISEDEVRSRRQAHARAALTGILSNPYELERFDKDKRAADLAQKVCELAWACAVELDEIIFGDV